MERPARAGQPARQTVRVPGRAPPDPRPWPGGRRAHRIIRERAAGCFANDPARSRLSSPWLVTKRRLGHLPPLPPEAAAGFTRAEQFTALEGFLAEIAPALEQ